MSKLNRKTATKLHVKDRIKHHNELYILQTSENIKGQASRCMDCGISYCNYSCPLGNVIPDLNELVNDGKWEKALDMLHKTNNFPEFTGRLCPALCEASCTLGINGESTTIREIELSIIEKGFNKGWVKPILPLVKTNQKVAVVGSGPAGLTVAQQLVRLGHSVTVFERDDQVGGILRLGIPDYKLEKRIINRRINQLIDEGVKFKTGVHIGVNMSVNSLKDKYDVICLCGGSTIPRNLNVEGKFLSGIHFAMDFLTQQNIINDEKKLSEERICAKDKNVVIIGGGDTGADCLGVSIRQGAKEVFQLELMPKPPENRTEDMVWPYWPMILRTNTSHEEGGERKWSVRTTKIEGTSGKVQKINCVKVEWEKDEDGKYKMIDIPNSEFEIKADLVLFAMGFLHPQHEGMLKDFEVPLDERGNILTNKYQINNSNIFTAGDMHTGQSLVCKAISDGRKAAKSIDDYLQITSI